MTRLVVYGEHPLWSAVAIRLRGAAIDKILTPVDPLPSPTDYDAILFATIGIAASQIAEALATGKPALVLSGCVTPPEDLESIVVPAGVPFSIVNPDRYLPSRDLVKQQFDVGKLGAPGLIRIHRWESLLSGSDTTQCSLPSSMINDIDLALWITGKSPNAVFATECVRDRTGSYSGRTIQLHLGFSDGAMVLIDYTSQPPAGDDYQSFSIIGSAGAAYADDHQNVQLLYQGGRPRAVRVEEEVRQFANLTQEFVDVVSGELDLSGSVADWKRAIAVVRAAESSLTSRRAVAQEVL